LVKSNLRGSTAEIIKIYELDNQTGTTMGFDPVPSTSSVIVNIKVLKVISQSANEKFDWQASVYSITRSSYGLKL
jgi:hypothetical protein